MPQVFPRTILPWLYPTSAQSEDAPSLFIRLQQWGQTQPFGKLVISFVTGNGEKWESQALSKPWHFAALPAAPETLASLSQDGASSFSVVGCTASFFPSILGNNSYTAHALRFSPWYLNPLPLEQVEVEKLCRAIGRSAWTQPCPPEGVTSLRGRCI